MKKIPTMFVRDKMDPSKILDEPHPDCLWVFQGFGRATRKYDGTACLCEGDWFYKRHTVKPNKPIPLNFKLAELEDATGKRIGWLPVSLEADPWHVKAKYANWNKFEGGTYELVGPKVQGNPEGYLEHTLISHTRDVDVYEDVPRTFDGLREWLSSRDIEGIVFQHPDGRMAKIKKRDFGLPRKAEG